MLIINYKLLFLMYILTIFKCFSLIPVNVLYSLPQLFSTINILQQFNSLCLCLEMILMERDESRKQRHLVRTADTQMPSWLLVVAFLLY